MDIFFFSSIHLLSKIIFIFFFLFSFLFFLLHTCMPLFSNVSTFSFLLHTSSNFSFVSTFLFLFSFLFISLHTHTQSAERVGIRLSLFSDEKKKSFLFDEREWVRKKINFLINRGIIFREKNVWSCYSSSLEEESPLEMLL